MWKKVLFDPGVMEYWSTGVVELRKEISALLIHHSITPLLHYSNSSKGGFAMKSYRKELFFNVPTRRALINITPEVDECLRESGMKEGLVLVKAK